MLQIYQFPCLKDNYSYIIHDNKTNTTASIDAPDAGLILKELRARNLSLDYILNTHHHPDHIGGNIELKKATQCQIIAPQKEQNLIPMVDIAISDRDEITFGSYKIKAITTPGHTLGHIIYYLPQEDIAFVGDTIFSLGCGFLFEGTPAQMWNSLQKIMALPENTKIYCSHEYTLDNAKFAITIEPKNKNLLNRIAEVKKLRAANNPTIPTSIKVEKETNPFLRPDSPEIKGNLNMLDANNIEIFAKIRQLKNNFRPKYN